jgi:hypothetical protein
MPSIILERLPEITKSLALLSIKSKDERVKILVDNEKYIAKGVNEFETESEDEDGEGAEKMED